MFTNNGNNNMQKFSQMMSLINSGNPQQIVMSALERTAGQGNPVAANLMQLAKQGNTKEIENIARNIAKEKGIDFDKEFNSFKQMFRL